MGSVEWVPKSYQPKAVDWLKSKPSHFNGGGGNFINMGLGKTSVILEAFRQLKEEGKATTMLVVAPRLAAQLTWPGEITKWINFSHFKFVVLHGAKKDALLRTKADIYIINYEGLDWLTNSMDFKATDIIAFDELHRMKTWSTKRVKIMKPFLPLFRYRWGVTGTPATNTYIDLFSQSFILDMGETFGPHITKYKAKYFHPPRDFRERLRPYREAIPEIAEKLAQLFYRLDYSDEVTLPTEIYNKIKLELPKKLRRDYKELEDNFILEVEHGVITALSANAKSSKLRQFLSGSIYKTREVGELTRKVIPIHELKADALEELVDGLKGEPLLVAYYFQHEVEMYRRRFPSAVFMEDYTSTEALKSLIQAWDSGGIPLMFGHPASIGLGLNLQKACHNICFTSMDFNYENYIQFIKRVSRQGQPKPYVVIHMLMFSNSIDEKLFEAATEKGSSQNRLLDLVQEMQQ